MECSRSKEGNVQIKLLLCNKVLLIFEIEASIQHVMIDRL